MSGLIEEIQAQALNPEVSVSALLRRVKLAAAKLGREDAIGWVDRELKGYGSDADIPAYRQTIGQLKAHTPFHGVRPVVGHAEWIEKICGAPIRDSITRVESLAGDGKGEVAGQVTGEIENALNAANNSHGTQYYIHTSQAAGHRPSLGAPIDRHWRPLA